MRLFERPPVGTTLRQEAVRAALMGGHVLTVGETPALFRAADVGDSAEVTGASSATGASGTSPLTARNRSWDSPASDRCRRRQNAQIRSRGGKPADIARK